MTTNKFVDAFCLNKVGCKPFFFNCFSSLTFAVYAVNEDKHVILLAILCCNFVAIFNLISFICRKYEVEMRFNRYKHDFYGQKISLLNV